MEGREERLRVNGEAGGKPAYGVAGFPSGAVGQDTCVRVVFSFGDQAV